MDGYDCPGLVLSGFLLNGVWIYWVMEGASLLELGKLYEVVGKVFSRTRTMPLWRSQYRRESVELRWVLYCMHVTASLDKGRGIGGPRNQSSVRASF